MHLDQKQALKRQAKTRTFWPASKPPRLTLTSPVFLRARPCYQAAYDPSLNIFPPQLWLFNPNKKSRQCLVYKKYIQFNIIALNPASSNKCQNTRGDPQRKPLEDFKSLQKSPTHQHLAESRPSIKRRLEAPANEASTVGIAAEPANASIGRFWGISTSRTCDGQVSQSPRRIFKNRQSW